MAILKHEFGANSSTRILVNSRRNDLRLEASGEVLKIYAGSSTGLPGSTGNGGLASSALLFGPRGCFIVSSSNLYIAEFNNNMIRKIISSTSIITTVAGTGVAGSTLGASATSTSLNNPRNMILDSSGNNMYIADSGNGCIRRVLISNDTVLHLPERVVHLVLRQTVSQHSEQMD